MPVGSIGFRTARPNFSALPALMCSAAAFKLADFGTEGVEIAAMLLHGPSRDTRVWIKEQVAYGEISPKYPARS